MDYKERLASFAQLGETLRQILAGNDTPAASGIIRAADADTLISECPVRNPWFTTENVRYAMGANAHELTEAKLSEWLSAYPQIYKTREPRTVAVVMAGNIPLVGFHDFLTVLISGNRLLAKPSSKDAGLTEYIAGILIRINPLFADRISFAENELNGFDAVIATGSDNSARYFEYYFGKYPHVIRKNRNSVGVISGNESEEELRLLGNDVFRYFGLGCRNVTKLFLPRGYDHERLVSSWSGFSSLLNHNKYANNYDFSKAVFMVNREEFTDGGFFILKPGKELTVPVSVVHYEHYDSESALEHILEADRDRIQCIAGRRHIPFGNSQSPQLWDYADGIDTLDFLLKKI